MAWVYTVYPSDAMDEIHFVFFGGVICDSASTFKTQSSKNTIYFLGWFEYVGDTSTTNAWLQVLNIWDFHEATVGR